MKQWIPYIGVYFVMKAPFGKSLVHTHYWTSMVWHGIWNTIFIYGIAWVSVELLK